MAKKYRLGPTRRAINLLVTAMVKLGIGQKGTYLLTTLGRKTKQQRTTPVILVDAAAERWLVSPYGMVAWVHNVRANPEVTIRRGRRIETLYAEELDPEAAGPVLQRYVSSVRVTAPFFDAKRGAPSGEFIKEVPRHPVFKLVSGSA